MSRDENRDKARVFFNKSTLAKKHRDEVNHKIKTLKVQRKQYFKERDDKAHEKKELIEILNNTKDNKEKKQLYERLLIVKKELSECYDRANTAHEEVQSLAEQSQEQHINMQSYRQMGKQAQATADELHKEVVEISKIIRKLFKERNSIKRSH